MEKHRRSNQHRRFKSFLFSPLWTRAVAGFAAIVIFSATYWLILPASALTKNAAADVSGLSLEQSGEILVESEETPEDSTLNEQEEPAAVTTAENADSVPGPGAGNDGSAPDGSAADSSSGWEPIPEAEQPVLTEETTPVAGESVPSDGAIADSVAVPSEPQTTVAEDANAGNSTGAEDNSVKEATVNEEEKTETVELTTEETTEELLAEEEPEEESKKEEEVFGNGKLLFRGNNYSVTIEYGEDAKIPVAAELRVRELEADSDEYQAHYETAKSNAEENGAEVRTARFFDITIVAPEKSSDSEDAAEESWREIEPAAPVKVNIVFDKEELELPENAEVEVLHFADENNAETVEKEKVEVETSENSEGTAVSGVGFDADAFSVFGIVGTETITVDYLTADGKTYTITVTFDEREELSNDMELIVSEIDEDTESFARYLDDAKAAMGLTEEDEVAFARFFDITIKMDGQKFEPVYPTTVAIGYKEAIEIGEDEALSVVHFAESGTEVIGDEEITISDDNKEIVYEQNSFSITGTIVAMTGWNKWPPAGNYLLAVKKDDNTYIVDKDGNLLPVTMDDAGKITIDSIDSLEDLNSGNYIWTLSKSGSVYNLENDSNYLYPSKATGLSTSRETKNCVANYNNGSVNDQKGLSVSNTNYMFDRMFEDTSTWNTTYVPRYLGINAAGTKLTGNQTLRTTQSYLVRSIHVDGEEYTLDDLPTFDEPTDVNWDFERNVYDPDIINTLKAPDTKKILTDNSDGTYDLTLSITGQSVAASDVNKVDVVVVIDRSTSMNVGNRLRSAVDAAKAIGTTDSLFQNSGVQISVIDFDTTVGSPSQWYTSDQASQYQSYVESLSGTIPNNHYTNWQQALKAAGNRLMDGRDDAYKYVVFLTDGNPTVYGTNGDQYGGTEGPGRDNDANWGTCTNAALPYAQKLIKEGAALYVVGCGEATNAYTFTARAYYGDSYDQMSGAPAGRYLDASDDTIGSAFASVAEEIIASFTYADVAFNDGITTDYTATTLVEGNVSAASIKVIDKNGNDVTSTEGQYVSVDYTGGNAKLSFKYVKASDGTTLAVGAVTEGIGDNAGKFFDSNGDQVVPYTLKNGYIYSATFQVWPKQEAMDRIAELNNGAAYTEADEEKGIVSDGNGGYTLNTNTHAILTYKTVTTVEGEDPVYSEVKTVDNIPCTDENGDPASIELITTGMVLQKLWNVGLQTSQFTNMYSWTYGGDTGRSEPMLHLEYTDSSSVTHNEQFHVMPIAANAPTGSIIGTDWPVQTSTGVYQTLYTKYSIAPGIMVTTVPSGVTAKDTWTIGGTTYYVLETGHDYVITEDHISGNMEPLNEIYHPMIFGDKLYNVVESNGTRTMTEMNPEVLTVNNYLRGGINVSKKVVDAENAEITTDTSTFQVKIDVTIPSGTASSFSSWDNKYVIWYDTYASQEDAAAGHIMYEVNGKPAEGVDSSDITQNFNFIDVTSGSGTKTLDIKAGWVIRLVNVLDGTTYTVTETENNGYEVTYSLNGGTASATPASGSVNKNAENNVQVINKQTTVPVVFKKLKTGTTDEYLDGAVFKITKWNGSSFVNVENVEGVDASSMFTIASGQNGISLPLTPGDYMLEEQTPPPGYIKTVSGVYFTVGSTISMTIEMKEIEGVETEVAKTEAAYAEPDSGDSDQRTLLIYNTPGVELPSTGGPGTLLYTLSGLALMLGAALMYGFRMRRRERRLN